MFQLHNLKNTTVFILICVSLVAAIVFIAQEADLASGLVDRVNSYGAVAPLIYVLVYIILAVGGFPRSVLAVVSGILFDPIVAVIAVSIAILITFVVTFMLARYYAGNWVEKKLEKIPTARKLMSAVEENGLRLLVLMRMNPFVPGFVNGYGFGLTSIDFRSYILGSMVGSLPLNLIYVYLGWTGGRAILLDIDGGEGMQTGNLVLGLVVSTLAFAVIAYYGRRALKSVEE